MAQGDAEPGERIAELEDALAEQREKLAELRSLETQIHDLRERERDLEVELIAASTSLERHAPPNPPQLSNETTMSIGASLERKQELEQRLAASKHAKTGELGPMHTARDALSAWIEAPQTENPGGTPVAARAILLVVVLGASWAAMAIHLAFLLLLIPLATATALLRSSGKDTGLQRISARRKFEDTRVRPPPEAWTEVAVQERLAALDATIDESRKASRSEPGHPGQEQAVEAELARANADLSALMAEAGLDLETIGPDAEAWLRAKARKIRIRAELDQVKQALRSTSTPANELREGLFRFLSRNGQAPSGGRTSTEVLSSGLQRVASSNPTSGSA